jgi:hypothetical protein
MNELLKIWHVIEGICTKIYIDKVPERYYGEDEDYDDSKESVKLLH